MTTQEGRQLLLKDLSARLPYKTYIEIIDEGGRVYDEVELAVQDIIKVRYNESTSIRPYLRPMSSMTEEELNECVCQSGIKDIECPNWQDIPKEKQFEARLNHAIAVFLTDSNNIDWLLAHHFDFRGLIEKGLALEAPEGMYEI